SIARILFTSLSHPSRRTSHVGSPYRASYSLSTRRTSSGVMPSWFSVRAITFDSENISSIAISFSIVGIGHATTSLRKFLVFRPGACWRTIPFGMEAMMNGIVLQHAPRSEEHTSELQSRFDLVCRLLLEQKKT